MKTLVVYFSRKGYAKKLAEEAAARENADLLRLETSERTAGLLGFMWCGRFGMHRWEMPIKPYETDVSAYDRVIVVSPVWVFSVCAPVRAFLHQEKGRIRQVEYVLVHFSFPMRYTRTRAMMDALCGCTATRMESVVCQLGHVLRRREYAAQGSQNVGMG